MLKIIATHGVYRVLNHNQTVNVKTEIQAMVRVYSNLTTDDVFVTSFNRIIIVDNAQTAIDLITTNKKTRWLKCKDGTVRPSNMQNTLFHSEDERGEAYVLVNTANQKSVVPLIYLRPRVIRDFLDRELAQMYKESRQKFGLLVQEKRYKHTTYETQNVLAYNLIVQDLMKMAELKKALDDKKEKRMIVIYTTRFQKDFIKECFGDKVKYLIIDERIIFQEIKNILL